MDLKSFFNVEFRTDTEQKAAKIESDLRKVDSSLKKTQDEATKTADTVNTSGSRIAESTGQVDRRFKSTGDAATVTKGKVEGLSGGFKGLFESMAGFAKAGLVAAGITSVGVSVAASIATFREFEQGLADLSAITGASGKDLDFYAESARKMAASTTLGATDIVKAFQLIGSAKPELLQNAEALKSVTASAITLSEAAGTDVAQAADTMASALNQFGEGASEADRYINVMAAGANFGAAEISDMGEALKVSGVAAGNFGLSFEDANAALQLMSTNALKGSEAGTQFKGVIVALETKMSDEFKPSVVGMSQALENLGNMHMTAEQQVKLFGRENLIAGQILSGQSEKFTKMRDDITGTNMAYEQAEIRTNTLAGSQKMFGNAMEELALTLTSDTGVGNVLKWIVEGFTLFVQAITMAVDGIVLIVKGTFDLVAAFVNLIDYNGFLVKTFDETVGAIQYLAENFDYIKLIIANDMINAIAHLAEFLEIAFRDMIAPIQLLSNAFVDLVAYILDLSVKAAPVFDRIFGQDTASIISASADSIRTLKFEVKDHATIVADAGKKYDGFRTAMDETTEAEIDQLNSTVKLKEENKKKNAVAEETAALDEKAAKAAAKAAKAIEDVKEKAEDELYALTHTNKETAIYNALKDAGVTANSGSGKEIVVLIGHLEDEKEAVRELKETEEKRKKDVAQAAKDAAKVEMDAIKELEKSDQEAAEAHEKFWTSSRDTLSGFFFEFAKEGMGAFDTLVEGFKSMITKMIAEAAANQIILGVTTLIGGTTATTAQAAIGKSASSMLGGGESLFSGGIEGMTSKVMGGIQSGFNSLASGYEGIANIAQANGFQNVAGAARTSAGQYSGTMTNSVMNAGLNIGAGMVGAYAGTAVFGETTGIGSGIGGAIGSIWGPIGTMIGSFIGSGLEKGLGKLTGHANQNNDHGGGSFDTSTGQEKLTTWGENNQNSLNNANDIYGIIKGFADAMDSDIKGNIQTGKDGLKYNGQKFNSPDDLLASAFREIIKVSPMVDDALQEVILSFKGTAQEFTEFAATSIMVDELIKSAKNLTPELDAMIRAYKGTNDETKLFAASIVNMTEVLATNAVDDASAALLEAKKIESEGMIGLYNTQMEVVAEMAANFDGSALSAANLNDALVGSKTAAYQMTVGIMQLSDQMVAMFTNSAASIREQLMSEEELAKHRLEERDVLMESMKTLVNPEDISRVGKEIDRLNTALFSALSEDEKKKFGEEFAAFAEEAAIATSAQLKSTVDLVRTTQETQNAIINSLLQNAATKQDAAADKMTEAAQLFIAAALKIPSSIVVTVNGDGGDITG